MKKVVIFGGTGFLGLSLAKYLTEKDFHVTIIARNRPKEISFDFKKWDAISLGSWTFCLEGAYALVNLCGRSVDCIKTPENCDVILRSRVETTKLIGKALYELKNPPKVWIQMSTAHIYGDPPKQLCTENSSTGYGLAPFVGKAWEKAFLEAIPKGIREVRLRTSFVIGKDGGALKTLKRITKLGLGGKVGSGTQGMSWIHEYDLNQMILEAIENINYNGFYIASAPNPRSNKDFMKLLRKQMKISFGLLSPSFLVKFGAKYFFKTDPELALYGRYVKSERLEKENFSFKFPNLEEALEDLI